eukprot:308316_1
MGNKSTKNKSQETSEKAVSKLLTSKRFQEIWNKIHTSGIQPLYDVVQQAEKSNTKTIKISQNHIVSTYDIIVDLPEDTNLRAALYTKYKIELTEYFNNKYIPLFKQIKNENNNAHLISEFCKHWIYASAVARTMAQIFRYIERHYVKRQSGEIKSLSSQAYQIYYDIIKPYINDISTIILEFARMYRESGVSEAISGITVSKINECITIFIEMDKRLEQLNYKDINTKILQDMETFYNNNFTPKYWKDKLVSDCMDECKMYEERENMLFSKCLNETTYMYYKDVTLRLKTCLFDSMITNKWPILVNDIMEKKFKNIEISKQDYDSLVQLNNWMHKKKLTWKPHIQKSINKMRATCQNRFYIETLIYGLGRSSLNDDNTDVPADIVAVCFQYYDPKWILLHLFIFIREMLLELNQEVNLNTCDVVKINMIEINSIIFDIYGNWSTWNISFHSMAAEYINNLFYNINNSDIKHKLNYISQLFMFWNGNAYGRNFKSKAAPAFHSEYMKLFCNRLLSDDQNIELELMLIEEFDSMNIDILQKISEQSRSMLKDITKSNELCKEFYENKENDMSMELNVTCGYQGVGWNGLRGGIVIYNKPGCIESACVKFAKFCENNQKSKLNQKSRRKMDFILNVGYGEIEIEFKNDIKKIFIVSTVMILIFEAFNFSDKYSMKYFQTFSKKQNVIIVEETLSFLTTFGLLLKQKGEKQNEIYWSINEDFEYPMNRINLYHMFEVYKYNKSVPQFNERLQRHIVDACIVRTMKKRRSMSALELIKHIQKETSTMFRATDEFIKNRIKNLVELEYLEIDRSHYEPWYAYKL